MQIIFEYNGAPCTAVAVQGEFSSWKISHPLAKYKEGVYRGVIDLHPGIYQYKLLRNRQEWLLDPGNSWIDRTGECINNTLVVGGSTPPLYFAPCRRCWVSRDNHLWVHAEVETDAPVPEQLILRNENGISVAACPVEVLYTVGNRNLLKYNGHVPFSAVTAQFSGYPGRWTLPEPTDADAPAWLKGAVFYSIFVDRWFRGFHSPADLRASSRDQPSHAEMFYGGDLPGITESLQWIADLGVDALMLTPLYRSESPHRYDAVDFQCVDPRLGGEKALAKLIRACKQSGLRLVLDAAFTHCHCQHAAFQDVIRNQERSAFQDWFILKHFPVTLSDPDSYQCYPDHPELPMLNLSSPRVIEHFEQLVSHWMELGVDGLRFDAVEYGPPDTWLRLGRYARRHNPEVALIAECIFDSTAYAVDTFGVHCATDYARHDLLIKAVIEGNDAFERFLSTEQLLSHRLGPCREEIALQFIDSHDTNRLLTLTQDESKVHKALAHLLSRNECVLIYYGTELGLSSGCAVTGMDLAWPDRLPMPPLPQESESVSRIRNLIRQRQ